MEKFNSPIFLTPFDKKWENYKVKTVVFNSCDSKYWVVLCNKSQSEEIVTYNLKEISLSNKIYNLDTLKKSLRMFDYDGVQKAIDNFLLTYNEFCKYEIKYYEMYNLNGSNFIKMVIYNKQNSTYDIISFDLYDVTSYKVLQTSLDEQTMKKQSLLINRLNNKQLSVSLSSLNVKNTNLAFNLNNLISRQSYNDTDISILGLQEVSPATFEYLSQKRQNLHNYIIKGHSRFLKLVRESRISKFRFFSNSLLNSKYNEYNPIAVNNVPDYKITENTHYLPFIPESKNELLKLVFKLSLMPRIATVNKIGISNGKSLICINTHIDYASDIVQQKQIKEIIDIIERYYKFYSNSSDIILMGRFNLEKNDLLMQYFINILSEMYGLKMVSFSGSTNNNSKQTPVDYIFVPKTFVIEKNQLMSESLEYTNPFLNVKSITGGRADGVYCKCLVPMNK